MQSNEILTVVDSVSTEKGLDKSVIFNAIEIAMFRVFQCNWAHNAMEIAMFQVVIFRCLSCSWNLHAHGNCNARHQHCRMSCFI